MNGTPDDTVRRCSGRASQCNLERPEGVRRRVFRRSASSARSRACRLFDPASVHACAAISPRSVPVSEGLPLPDSVGRSPHSVVQPQSPPRRRKSRAPALTPDDQPVKSPSGAPFPGSGGVARGSERGNEVLLIGGEALGVGRCPLRSRFEARAAQEVGLLHDLPAPMPRSPRRLGA